MKRKLVYNNSINWGWLFYFFFGIVLVMNITILYYAYLAIQAGLLIFSLTVLGLVPILVLNYFTFPIALTLAKKENNLKLYTTGVEIKKNNLDWKNIKSISFHNGRLIHEKPFYRGIKLPTMQKIFVLDKKGEEYSCNIDIDYLLKLNRKKNNLVKIRELLLGLDKMHLISDWAEKR